MVSVAGLGGLDWVDWILIALGVLAAVRGLRMGAAVQVLSYGGFWLGLVVGALVAPAAVAQVNGELSKAVVSLVVVFGVAAVLGAVGRGIGGLLWKALRRIHLGLADSTLGLVVAVAATLLACWLGATILVQGPSPTLAAGIANSKILQGMDQVLPPSPSVFNRIRAFVNTSRLPQVFSGIAPVTAGPVKVAGAPAVQQAVRVAGGSMVEVLGAGCNQIQEGSGFVVAPGLVVTNAHVVAGIPHPVVVDRAGARRPAEAIYFNPRYDLAVLRVPGLSEPPLRLDPSDVPRGTQGAVLGYPEGGPFTAVPAGVIQRFQATGPDIYGQGSTVRNVYAIQAVVRPGNSGGPLVEPNGEVIGVVFSKSVSTPRLGYALASPGVEVRVAQAEAHPGNPGTGACTSA